MIQTITQSLRLIGLIIILCGVFYPGMTYYVGQAVYPEQANGSIVYKNDVAVGSALLGQYNRKPEYFWPRPSAHGKRYNPSEALASNLPYYSNAYHAKVRERYKSVRDAHDYFEGEVPVDMVTTSASGLDPHISPHAAYLQVIRLARSRNQDSEALYALIDRMTEEKQWGVFGARRVNVLLLNLALDEADNE